MRTVCTYEYIHIIHLYLYLCTLHSYQKYRSYYTYGPVSIEVLQDRTRETAASLGPHEGQQEVARHDRRGPSPMVAKHGSLEPVEADSCNNLGVSEIYQNCPPNYQNFL